MKLPERAHRFHAVLYMLAGGSTDVQVKFKTVCDEIDRLGVMSWSDEKFREWEKNMVAEVKARRAS